MPNGGLQPFGVALVVENLPAYERAANRVSEAQENMGATADQAAESAGRLDLAYAAAGATLALIARKIVGTLQSWVMTAARAEELDETLVLMGNTVGQTREEIMRVRQAVIDLGVTQSGANRILQTAIQANLSFEDTLKLVRRAQELAVPAGLDSTTTAIDLMRAIASGNVVLLRKYGILGTLRQEMRRGDAATKKSVGELSSAARAQMTFNLIMRESEVYVGAYERAMEFASKQMRSWPRYIEEIKRSFGDHLLPVLGFAVDKINLVLKGLVALPPEIKAFTTYTLALTAAILGGAAALALFNTQFVGRFMVALKALPGLLLGLPNMIASALVTPWGLAAAAIGAFAVAVVFDIADMQSHFVATFQRMRIAVEAFAVAVRQIVSAILTTWETLSTNFQLVADQMYRVFVQSTGEITRVGQNLTETNFGIQFDPYRFAEGAASLMIGFAEGLVQGLLKILPIITEVVGAIASFFGGSLPERGPLADIVISGTELIRNYLRGMSEASLDDVAKIAEDIGEALAIPLFEASEAIREIQMGLRDLDDLLHPLELEIRKIEAAASLISIPLQRQIREMDKIIGQLEDQERLQDAMAAERLAMLEDELSLLQEVIGADQSRLKVVQLQIELERKRLRESGRFDSEHLRSLMQQQGALKTGLIVQAARGEELEAETEQARIIADEAKATESARLVLYRQERAALEGLIAAEDERLRFAREEMVLAQARQIDQRIAFEEELTAWQRRQEEMDYYASLAQRVLRLVTTETEKAKKKAKEYADVLDRIFQKVEDTGRLKGTILDPARIAEMKRRIAEMMKPLLEEMLPQLKTEWDLLQKSWEDLVIAFEIKFIYPDAETVKENILKLFEEDLPTLIGEKLFGLKFIEAAGGVGPIIEEESYTWGELAALAFKKGWEEWMKPDEPPPGFVPPEGFEFYQKQLEGFTKWWDKQTAKFFWKEGEKEKGFWAKFEADLIEGLNVGGKILSDALGERMAKEGASRTERAEAARAWWAEQKVKLETAFSTRLESARTHFATWKAGLDTWLAERMAARDAWRLEQKEKLDTWIADNTEKLRLGLIAWKTKISEGWTNIKTAIGIKLAEIIDKIKEWLGLKAGPGESILDVLGAKKFLDSMVEMGKTIFQSLWDGLKKKAGSILEWIKGIAKGWIRSIKGLFGIVGDPYSLVFQGIGESLVTGLERGMEGFRPVLQAQVSALMAAVPERQAVPAPGRGAFGGNTYNTISGPTYQLTAQYSAVQAPASIRDDLALMTMIGM